MLGPGKVRYTLRKAKQFEIVNKTGRAAIVVFVDFYIP
jgi:hypothetical protein